MSLATRIFLGHAVVLVTFGLLILFSVSELHRNQQEIRLVSQGYLPLVQDAAALDSFQRNQAQEAAQISAEADPQTRAALARLAPLTYPPLLHARLSSLEATLSSLRTTAPASERSFLDAVQARVDHVARDLEVVERTTASTWSDKPPPEAQRTLASAQDSLSRELRALRAALDTRTRAVVEEAERRDRRRGVLLIGLSVAAIAVGLLATALSARSLRPVRALIAGVGRIRRGDYTGQLNIPGDDEISQLGREFDAMTRALEEREQALARQQQALLRAERLAAVGRVSAQVAHEVRNPLSSIGLNVEMLQDALDHARFGTPAEAEEVKALLQAVTREVDRLTETTERYLRMARSPAPALVAEDVNRIVDGVLDFAAGELGRAGIRVERRLDPGLPRALVDEGQLRQVLLNLVRNAREAMEGGGTLRLFTSAEDGAVHVRVEDTGHGIPEEARPHLFDPLFTTKRHGTGLGLALSRQILEAHGGALGCERTGPSGTVFHLRVPVAPRTAVEEQPVAHA
ncbi:MAG TPA: ATP-binding protein [Myxococcaceae bacterium]|nr:ATP-binding protein [Myxococcaceae bacterium]